MNKTLLCVAVSVAFAIPAFAEGVGANVANELANQALRIDIAERNIVELGGSVSDTWAHADKANQDNIKQDATIKQAQKDIVANTEAIRDAQKAAGDAFKTAVNAANNNHRQDQILDKHGSDIASNTEAIRAHYAEMKDNFAAVNTRLDNLDNEMKKGFAANAAIAGLFQPYSVGKFNVTAALGGYDSEQAIAIGSGYRFNETFAMKAGVATNTSDFDAVTYNVGVNFEW